MKDFTIKSFVYNEDSLAARKSIAKLLNVVWPEPIDETNQMIVPVTHGVELNAQTKRPNLSQTQVNPGESRAHCFTALVA